MAATKAEIREWFKTGVERDATHMIVVCDTFNHEDYPVYVMPGENVREREAAYSGKEMQKVMEVYDLRSDMEKQMADERAWNF